MKKKTIKFVSLLLCLALTLGIMCAAPFAVSADTDYKHGTTGQCTWSVSADGKTLTISGNGDMGGGNQILKIRYYSLIDDLTYMNYGIWHDYITTIVIEEGVTGIGEVAFADLVNVTNVVLPQSLTRIGPYAFWNNKKMTDITIPDSVTKIDDNAFCSCKALKNVKLSENLAAIDDYTFYGCSALENINIPNSVRSIGTYAFRNCSALQSIDIPDGVTKIGDQAFMSCTSLEEITIAESVTEFGDRVFSNTALWNNMEDGMFIVNNCLLDYKGDPPAELIIPDGIKRIYGVRNKSTLTKVNIPAGVIEIGTRAFDSCGSLSEVNLSNGIKRIGHYAFYGCHDINEINIPNGVTEIGNYAFFSCDINELILPDGLNRIGNNAFSGCALMTKLVIPDSVSNLGEQAFSNCFKLTDLTLSKDIRYYNNAFVKCINLKKVIIPVNATTVKNSFKDCTALESVLLLGPTTYSGSFSNATIYNLGDSGECKTIFNDNVLIVRGTGAMADYSDENPSVWSLFPEVTEQIDTIVVEEGVTSIGNNAFKDFTNLKSVTLPSTVTRIGDHAFENCTSLATIPNFGSVTYMGKKALDNTAWLNNMPEGMVYAGDIFYTCKGECPALYRIQSNIRVVAAGALSGCETLEQIGISEGVVYINDDAFNGCPNLIAASFGHQHVFGDGAFLNCPKLVFYGPKKGTPYPYATAHNIRYGIMIDESGDCEWVVHAGVLVVSGEGAMEDYASPDASPFVPNITSIIIEEGVTKIGENAFAKVTALNEIHLPKSLTSIPPASAFPPDEVAFTAYVYRGSLAEQALKDRPNTTLVYLSNKSGDVNGDNNVDVLDAAAIQKYASDKTGFDETQFDAADVNGDNNVDVLDAALIQKYAADKIKEFPKA